MRTILKKTFLLLLMTSPVLAQNRVLPGMCDIGWGFSAPPPLNSGNHCDDCCFDLSGNFRAEVPAYGMGEGYVLPIKFNTTDYSFPGDYGTYKFYQWYNPFYGERGRYDYLNRFEGLGDGLYPPKMGKPFNPEANNPVSVTCDKSGIDFFEYSRQAGRYSYRFRIAKTSNPDVFDFVSCVNWGWSTPGKLIRVDSIR